MLKSGHSMDLNLIFSNIAKHIHLTSAEKEIIAGNVQVKKVKKNTNLLWEGEICEHIYFVNTGVLRAYCLNANGKESTVMFALQDWWITDMYCFLNCQPSMVYLKAMRDSEVVQISRSNLELLFEHIPSLNKFFRILMQNAYCREQLRMIQNLTLPAKQRYENFITKYPIISQNVALKHIASYIGVTPEFLSNVRGNFQPEHKS